MKTAKKLLSLLLALALIAGLGAGAAAETDRTALAGTYSIFAVQYMDDIAKSDEMGLRSTLELRADGTGYMDMDGDGMDIASWTPDGESFTVTMADGSSAGGNVLDGFLALDLFGGGYYVFYYTKAPVEGLTLDDLNAAIEADAPDSRLHAFWSGLDAEKGVHLQYDLHTDYLDATQRFDVHGRNDVFYSRRTTEVSGYTDTVVTFFRDGTAYTLYPDKMSGSVATTTSVVMKDVLMMDTLYSDIAKYAREKTYTEEKREFEGAPCVAEVFPATAYTPETAFYFNDAGELVACVAEPPVSDAAAKIGRSVYAIHAIDERIDEALFDISGYAIS